LRIIFARHGESEANRKQIISNRNLPHGLTEVGVSQAYALAQKLADWEVVQVFASPILRAKETGSIIAETFGLPLKIESALREFDCGMLEGRGDDEAWAALSALIRAWDEEHDYARQIMPDGESFDNIRARFVPFMANLISVNADLAGDILLISHGAVLHQMLPLLFENVDRAFTQEFPLPNCALVVGETHNSRLVCVEWAGVKTT